jgi:hypothetical protein
MHCGLGVAERDIQHPLQRLNVLLDVLAIRMVVCVAQLGFIRNPGRSLFMPEAWASP